MDEPTDQILYTVGTEKLKPTQLIMARAAAAAIRDRVAQTSLPHPRVAIVLGSGLGGITTAMQDAMRIPYRDIPAFPEVHVVGHAGEVVMGTLANVPAIAFAGRFHMYEGHSAAVAGFPVRVAHALGAETLIVSNAAGAVNTEFVPGDLMIINDHLNLMGSSPLVGGLVEGDIRFPDMSMPYDPELRARLHDVARSHGVTLRDGVYAALLGPSYETRAEIRMLRILGADAVAMSLVPEVIVARALGMRVVGISCITNMACGVTEAPLDHADVIAVTSRVAEQFQTLVKDFVATL